MLKAVAIIPARIGSKRLKEKNIREIDGQPMIGHVIVSAGKCLGFDNVYVSTESDKVAEVVQKYYANVIKRPEHLAGDTVLTEPVIQHALEEIEKVKGRVELVIWLNASIPEILPYDILQAITKLEDYNLWEVCPVDKRGICNSGVRVMRREALEHKGLSVYQCIIERDYMDIHYEEDLIEVEKRLKLRQGVR